MLPGELKIPDAVPRGAQSILDALRAGDFGLALELAEALVRLITPKTPS